MIWKSWLKNNFEKYLPVQDILILHAKLIDETGGVHGVRDIGLLQSATVRPQAQFGGHDAYKGVFEKAAAYYTLYCDEPSVCRWQ